MMNSKRGFKRIIFTLAAVAALSGTVIGVSIVINEYESAKGFLQWKREILARNYGDITDKVAFENTGEFDVQVGPDSSEATSRIEAMESGFTEGTPRIEASFISGSGNSFISVGGKLFREGDIINGFRFLKVYPDKVEFEKNGKIVVGTINTQTSTRPKSNDLLQQPVSSKQARYKDTYYKQYRQPTYSKPSIAENDSYYGQISENTGRPKTVHVRGYYRKDGTYVRSHYRSPPRR